MKEDVLQCRKKYGQRLDLEIAAERAGMATPVGRKWARPGRISGPVRGASVLRGRAR